MTARRDPHDMAPASTPSDVELDESDRLLSELGAGMLEFSSDPVAQLLHTARGPGTAAELVDRVGFADRAVATASLAAVDHDAGAVDATTLDETERPERRRLAFVGRVLAAKAALIAGIGVIGVAGAGAATGAIIVNHRADPPSTTTPTPTEVPAAEEPRRTDDEPQRSSRTEAPATSVPEQPTTTSTLQDATVGSAPTVAPTIAPSPPSSTVPATSTPPNRRTEPATPPTTTTPRPAPVPSTVPTPAPTSPGAGAGNGSSSGGNGNGNGATNKGGNGAANGNSPNAGGTPGRGDLGANNGNGAGRSGVPATAPGR